MRFRFILLIFFFFLSGSLQSNAQERLFTDKTNGGSEGGLVGAIESEYTVTPTGQFRYEIPIPTLAGTGGMKPNISVTYDSSTKDGLAGYGFDLTGLSVIHRVPSNVFNDTRASAVNFSNTDNFALDGARMLISDNTKSDRYEYRTELDSHAKIVSTGDNRNPSSFTVHTKSGLQYIYKPLGTLLAAGSDSTLFWPVEKVMDTSGNYYTLTYTGDICTNEYYVDHIDYTANDNTGLTPYASIKFRYEANGNAPTTYIHGRKVRRSKILSSIEILYGNECVKKFQFVYRFENGRRFLTKVREKGKEESFLNPTVFDWHLVEQLNVTNVNYTRTSSIHKASITIGDFNGDGKSDFIVIPENKNAGWKGWKIFISNGMGFTNDATGDFHWPDHEVQQVVSGDFNGDGLADIVVKRYVPTGYYNCDLYTSSVHGNSVALNFEKCFISSKDNYSIQRVEVNGDGADDLFLWYKDSKKCNIIYSTKLSGSIIPFGYTAERQCSVKFDSVVFVDFNGDGLTDVLNLDNNGNYLLQSDGYGTMSEVKTSLWVTKKHHIQTGDFNGDGKTDILATGWDGDPNKDGWSSWIIFYSKGNNSFELQYFTRCLSDADYELIASDLNGDGFDDLQAIPVKSGNSMVNPIVFLNQGTSVFSRHATGGNIYGLDKWRFYTGDFNGDGKIDMLCTSDWNKSNWDGYQLYLMPGDPTYLLSSATDGLGNKVSVNYNYMSDASICTDDGTSTYPIASFGTTWPLVKSVSFPDGIGGVNTISYKYGNPMFHVRGRGFLCFESFSQTDGATGIVTTDTYEVNLTKYVVGLKSSCTKKGNKILSKTEYTNVIVPSQTRNNGANIFSYLSASSHCTSYEYNSNEIVSDILVENTYDKHGNITASIAKSDNLTTTIENEYSNDEDRWILGRLTKTVVTKEYEGENITKKTEFKYDTSTGLLTEECIEPDNQELGLMKVYGHDPYGNITSSVIKPLDGSPSRTTSSRYDEKGRFLVASTNSLGFEEKYDTDDETGLLVSSTDCNNITTTNSYDAFGNPIQAGTPVSKTVTTTGWASGMEDAPSAAVYFKYAQTTGKPYTIEFYDCMGRPIREVKRVFGDKKSFRDYVYNTKGQLIKESEPYFPTGTICWNINEYDEVGRIIRKTDPSGNASSISYYGLTTVTTDAVGSSIARTCDRNGNLVTSTDNEGTEISYTYDPEGRCTAIGCSKKTIRVEYDITGNKTLLDDPDYGTVAMVYNPFGELIQKSDPYGISTFTYDKGGRTVSEEHDDCTITTTYDTGFKGEVSETSITGISADGHFSGSKSYEYDKYGRLVKETTEIDGKDFVFSLYYNSLNHVIRINYPSGIAVKNNYDSDGFLYSVTDCGSGHSYWEMLSLNARGQIESEQFGNGLVTSTTHDLHTGLVTGIVTPGIQNWGYAYDAVGNLLTRKDNSRNLEEKFLYDSLHRITEVLKNNTAITTVSYDAFGNITYKSDVGYFTYKPGNNRVSTITQCACSPKIWDEIRYNSMGKVSHISSGTSKMDIDYGPDGKCMRRTAGSTVKYHVGKLFERSDYDGHPTCLSYIYAGGKAVALVLNQIGASGKSTLYIHTDNLGSVQAYSDDNGNLHEEFSYDAWGMRRNPTDWVTYSDTEDTSIIARGFTGHDHLDMFCIIDMGGRMYDPLVGRFLSPDPIVQQPDFSQGLNRYSYCLNNPLSLIDPTGYSWLSKNWKSIVASIVGIGVSALTLGTGSTVGIAIIAGAAGGAACALTGALLNGANMGQIAKNTLIGGMLGAAGGFLNFASADSNLLLSIVKHSFSQGWLDGIQGGNVLHGFMMGAVSKIGGTISDSFSQSLGFVGSLMMNSILSGAIDELGGGKFANGAITGAFSYLFNETLHRTQDRGDSDEDGSILATTVPIALAASALDGPFPIGDAIGACMIVCAGIYDETQRIYLTYTLTNDAGQIYVGRTSGFGDVNSILKRRYYAHHMRVLGFKNPKIDRAIQGKLGYGAIRGREQQLIDFYGGIGSPQLANKIRGVSKFNVVKGKIYHAQSNFFFGNIAPYTGY